MSEPPRRAPGSEFDPRFSSGEMFLRLGFEDRGQGRSFKWCAVAAICLHFAVFVAVIPVGAGREFTLQDREMTVIKRYTPPEPPRPKRRVVRRAVARVPIPDATPDEPEMIVNVDEIELPEEQMDTEYLLDGPFGTPQALPAVAMDTPGLEPPQLLEHVEPLYDRERARRGVQGAADIEIVIDEQGLVASALIINGTSDEELDASALEAVRQWKFVAATLAGDAVPVRAVVTINFRIY